MKKSIVKCFFAFVFIIILISSSIVVSAESSLFIPYESYTYWNDVSGDGRKLVKNRTMFEFVDIIESTDYNLESFSELVDVFVDNKENIYLLDKESRIVILDSEFNFITELNFIIKNSEKIEFNGATSLFVDDKQRIFIADTSNNRVLVCNTKGEYLDIYELPKSSLIPSNFLFKPIKVACDSKGYVYILSEGSYYGALLYAPDKSFVGFYGYNTVTNGILGSIQSLFNRMFPNNAKSSNSARKLPFAFNDIIIDKDNFVYTVTDSDESGQIKKLNPGEGKNIANSDEVNFQDEDVNFTFDDNGYSFKQRIISLDVDDNGFIYCLDASYGRIFLYDSECRMLTAFGGGMGTGTQKGTFKNATAIALKGESILVCDKNDNSITVFALNDYGKKVLNLTNLTINGHYKESKSGWQEILSCDNNLQMAYIGLARAYLAEENYEEALKISLEGYDRETYTLAFEYYRTEWVYDNFTILFIVVVSLIAVLIFTIVFIKKKNIQLIKNEKFKIMLNTMIHPSISFEKIKENHKGSVRISIILIILFYISSVIKTLFGGFVFTGYDPAEYNSLLALIQSAGLIILWIVSNWLVSTLMSGKGRFIEILIVTSYSLVPLIISNVVWTIISNFLLPSESAFLSILSFVAIFYSAILLIMGMLKIHEYTMTKFIGTTVLTLLGMIAILFLLVLIVILSQQLYGFIVTIFIEIFM